MRPALFYKLGIFIALYSYIVARKTKENFYMKHLLQIIMAAVLITGVVASTAGAKNSESGAVVQKLESITADRLFSSKGIKALIKNTACDQKDIQNDVKNDQDGGDDNGEKEKQPELIHIYNTKQDDRVSMTVREYLVGVLAAEMPASYASQALMAQAVAARTYLYNKMLAGGCNKYSEKCAICTFSGHCQGYLSPQERKQRWGDDFEKYEQKLHRAVELTEGQCLLYNGDIIKAMYHSSSAVSTEDYHSLYGGKKVEYLTSVTTPENKQDVRSQKILSVADFVKKMASYPDNGLDGIDMSKQIYISQYTKSGRVSKVRVGNYELGGTEFKGLFDLRSNYFTLSVTPFNVVITCYGHGHGIGMSQCGANLMALNGKSYKEILLHYYQGVQVETVSLPGESNYNEISDK